jgi:hydrogenase expression/formation protein HypC
VNAEPVRLTLRSGLPWTPGPPPEAVPEAAAVPPAVDVSALQCHDDVCITCSDQAVAVTVVELLADDLALVDTGVSREEVSVALVEAGVGDTILVHAKEAIAVVGGGQS